MEVNPGTGLEVSVSQHQRGSINAAAQWTALAARLRRNEYHDEVLISSTVINTASYLLEPLDAVEDRDDYIPMIAAAIAANRTVKSVELHLSSQPLSDSAFQERLVRCIGEGLRANRTVKWLSLRFPVTEFLSEQTVGVFAGAIAENTSLLSVTLRVPGSYLSQFADALKRHTKLENIVVFVGRHRRNRGIAALMAGASCNLALHTLAVHGAGVDFEWGAPQGDGPAETLVHDRSDGVDTAVAFALSKLPALRTFSSFLYRHGLAVVSAIKAAPRLETVTICVDVPGSASLLFESGLRVLHLRLEGHCTAVCMIAIAESLQRNSSLNKLELDFGSVVVDEGKRDDAHDWDSASCYENGKDEQTPEGAFATAVRSNSSLKYLSLCTSDSKYVSRIVVAAAAAMDQNQSIRSLNVEARYNRSISKKVCEAISRALSTNTVLLNLPGMNIFPFDFSEHPDVELNLQRNRAVLELAEVWRSLALVARHGTSSLLRMVVASMGELAFCQRVFVFLLPCDVACAFQAKSASRREAAMRAAPAAISAECVAQPDVELGPASDRRDDEGAEVTTDASEVHKSPGQKAEAESQMQRALDESTAEANEIDSAALAAALVRSKCYAGVPPELACAVTVFEVTCHARSPELARVLNESPRLTACRALVAEAGCEFQPPWALGGWVLVPASEQQLDEAGIKLGHMKILARSCDMHIIEEELKSVSRCRRPRFKQGWVAADCSDAQVSHDANCDVGDGGVGDMDLSGDGAQPTCTNDSRSEVAETSGVGIETATRSVIAVIKDTFLNFYEVGPSDGALDSKTVNSAPCGYSNENQPRNPRSSSP